MTDKPDITIRAELIEEREKDILIVQGRVYRVVYEGNGAEDIESRFNHNAVASNLGDSRDTVNFKGQLRNQIWAYLGTQGAHPKSVSLVYSPQEEERAE